MEARHEQRAGMGVRLKLQAEQMLDAYFARIEIAFANRYPKGG